MNQFIPSTSKSISKFIWILEKVSANFFEFRVESQRQISGEHERRVFFVGIVRVGHRASGSTVFRTPLMRTGRRLVQLPLVLEQIRKVGVRPFRRRVRPRAFETAANRAAAVARAKRVLPAETLLLHRRAFWLGGDVLFRVGGAVALAKRVTARNQRHCLFVVHCHARERFANILCRKLWIGITIRTFWVHINQTHLNIGQWILQRLSSVAITFVLEPHSLRTPVRVGFRLPQIFATGGKAKRLEAHFFERHVANERKQIAPRQLLTVLFLDRPQQAACLV
mmetsp:Transcript_17185/g.29842  ORF Transcript_17185/g.29842 Transcript_17185/m.29842 type:complete len:281 (+) Transcript_17185:1015-1857(+)